MARYIVFDFETTGFSEKRDRVIEVCGIFIEITEGLPIVSPDPDTDVFHSFADPGIEITNSHIHGVTNSDVQGHPTDLQVMESFLHWCHEQSADRMVAHNVAFDGKFLNEYARRLNRMPLLSPAWAYCTMKNFRRISGRSKWPKLQEACTHLGIPFSRTDAHSALYDTGKTMELFLAMHAKGLVS